VLEELPNKKVSKLYGKEMEQMSYDISQLKLSTSHLKIISKDYLVKIKKEMDIGYGSQEILLLEELQVQFP